MTRHFKECQTCPNVCLDSTIVQAEMFSSLAEQVYVSDVHLSIGAGGTQGSWCLDSYTYRPANRTYEADGSVYSRAEVSLKVCSMALIWGLHIDGWG